jgi:GTPase-associated protein 1, N-terminal domain type 1
VDFRAMAEFAIIHQSLHGYRNGHKLIASSAEITDEDKRIMLTMSDYSGSGIENGFKTYLTGYPLQNSKLYVFARTWYADEMSRPGCVWTHSLLINFTDLWEIKESNALLDLFIRPNIDDPTILSKYSEIEKVSLKADTINKKKLNEAFYQVSCEFYNSSNQPVVFLSEDSSKLEDSILKLWDWQWPRMKRSFTFSTGSLSPRKINGIDFDLQILPSKRKRTIEGEHIFKIIPTKELDCQSPWSDLYRKIDLVDFRSFMVKFGSDLKAEKNTFISLLYLYQIVLDNELNLETLEKVISSTFPDPNEGNAFKVFLLDRLLKDKYSDKVHLLNRILNHPSLSRINWNYSSIIKGLISSRSLTIKDSNEFINTLIIQERVSDIKKLVLDLPLAYWSNISLGSHIYTELFQENPSLLEESTLWISNFEIQDEVFNSLLDLEKVDWTTVSISMLDFASLKMLNAISDWVNNTDKRIPHGWELFVRASQESYFICLGEKSFLSPAQINLASIVLNPSLKFWKAFGTSFFDRLFFLVNKSKNQSDVTGVFIGILTACYENNISNPLHVNTLIFQSLHDKMRQNYVDLNSWERFKWAVGRDLYGVIEQNFVSKLFEDRNSIPDWDRCEFLRRALLVTFLKYGWNPMNLIFSIQERFTFEKTVEFAIQIKEGKQLMKDIYNRIKKNDTDSFHLRVLKKYL